MDEAQWLPMPPREAMPPAGKRVIPPGIDICPGWIVRQPAVVDLCRAALAIDKHCFDALYPDPPAILVEGGLDALVERDRWQAEQQIEMSKGIPNGH